MQEEGRLGAVSLTGISLDAAWQARVSLLVKDLHATTYDGHDGHDGFTTECHHQAGKGGSQRAVSCGPRVLKRDKSGSTEQSK